VEVLQFLPSPPPLNAPLGLVADLADSAVAPLGGSPGGRFHSASHGLLDLPRTLSELSSVDHVPGKPVALKNRRSGALLPDVKDPATLSGPCDRRVCPA